MPVDVPLQAARGRCSEVESRRGAWSSVVGGMSWWTCCLPRLLRCSRREVGVEEGEGERRWTGAGRRRSDEQKHYTRLFGKVDVAAVQQKQLAQTQV